MLFSLFVRNADFPAGLRFLLKKEVFKTLCASYLLTELVTLGSLAKHWRMRNFLLFYFTEMVFVDAYDVA